jgi:murein DD-endopeptidase MepM/ murein hydrolase activator NlpD
MLDYSRSKFSYGAEKKTSPADSKKSNYLTGKNKGSRKNPPLRLGLAALFLIFVAFIGCSDSINKASADKSDFYLLEGLEKDALFIDSNGISLPESPEFILVDNFMLKATSPPVTFSSQVLGSLVAGYKEEDVKTVITEYIIEEGDSLLSLAAKFDISLNTILWANDLTEKSVINPGDKLVILPVSGVIHHIESDDTVSEIAETYKGKIEEIVAFNYLDDENDIYIGDILIVPNGIKPAKKQMPSDVSIKNSQFIVPVSSPYIITQGLHWYNAIDFSHAGYACGKPILAAAGGTVQKTGYHATAGYYVRILHPNGVVTFYGHLSRIDVTAGDPVMVGDIIGRMGNTGYTIGQTGCHLHFEVRGAKNPFAR